ncbi:hypothetical protein P5673_017350 [Acropora cervicornis]|uniref:Uncharacterized protein n=1 Tax=Acropora cervicornis TaxID=6130 RepID=A0AAD9V3F5_ACRCE|nr:hypothetical protein P5673_017350 [Acropora cervicornis]
MNHFKNGVAEHDEESPLMSDCDGVTKVAVEELGDHNVRKLKEGLSSYPHMLTKLNTSGSVCVELIRI